MFTIENDGAGHPWDFYETERDAFEAYADVFGDEDYHTLKMILHPDLAGRPDVKVIGTEAELGEAYQQAELEENFAKADALSRIVATTSGHWKLVPDTDPNNALPKLRTFVSPDEAAQWVAASVGWPGAGEAVATSHAFTRVYEVYVDGEKVNTLILPV